MAEKKLNRRSVLVGFGIAALGYVAFYFASGFSDGEQGIPVLGAGIKAMTLDPVAREAYGWGLRMSPTYSRSAEEFSRSTNELLESMETLKRDFESIGSD